MEAKPAVRVLIVDDHEFVRRGIRSLLGRRSDVLVCGEAVDGLQATELARELRPDIILMDISMPRMNGVDATRIIRQEIPEAEVILVSQNDLAVVRQQAAELGASGYVAKSTLSTDLVPEVVKVANKRTMLRDRAKPLPAFQAVEHNQTHTERNTELEAERANALLAAIVDSSDDAIVSKNLDGMITSWNRGAERIFGYGAAEAVGKHITLIIPPDRCEEEFDILARLRRGERVDHFETIRQRKDGTRLNVSLTISPVKDSSGRIIGASKVGRDITAQIRTRERAKQMTAETLAANAKFQAVFEQTSVFAAILGKDGAIIEANRLCFDGWGFRPEEILGLPLWEAPWWRNHLQVQKSLRDAVPRVADGIPYREMLQYSWADGAERLMEFALYPITDDHGEVIFLHPTGVDITDLKRAEESYRSLAQRLDMEVRARTRELEERNAEVLRQSELLREFSQRLMHAQDEERRHIARELHDSAGQTLTVLAMNLARLMQETTNTSSRAYVLARETEQLVQQLTREIRTTSYLLHPPLLDETGLAAALAWYIDGLRARSDLGITLNIAADFERLPQDVELVIFRVVQESLTNIHRHSGSKTAAISILRDSQSVLVRVEDQGQGMSAEKLHAIQSRGSGVGIRGMRERVRQFHGDMDIQSNHSGTRIVVTIPIPQPQTARQGSDVIPASA